jgi:hypothetical protein
MAKTKEEITTITTKNYFDVQKQELESVDALKTHHSAFTKEAKASLKEYSDVLKTIDKDEVKQSKEFAQQEDDSNKRHQERLQTIEQNKVDAKKVLDNELQEHQKQFDKQVKDLDKAIEKIQSAHEKTLLRLEESLQSDIEKSNKNISEIEEKGVKDDDSFSKKLVDLETKYNEKIESLKTKEQEKKEKLQESTTQKIASIEERIQKEEEKHNKALTTKQALYEEELEEIDEKIAFEKSEFETKYNNIKESVEKRIAVREKHLQRALNDNDKRSAKQHKKDIAKFQKEADHDLVVLEKNYNNKEKESATYRKQFIQDYYESIATFNEEYETAKEEKKLAIELEQATLENALAKTTFDYNEKRAKELREYNDSFASVREKQETATMQRNLAIEQEKHNQVVFAIDKEKAVQTATKELEDALETKAKERRVFVLEKQKDDDIANNTYQEALVRLDTEQEVANLELQRDLTVLSHTKNIATHKFQDKRHSAIKHEFASYQQHIGPLFLNRTRDIQSYEVVEINNRLKLKLAYFEMMKADLDKDYKVLEEKVQETHDKEAVHLEAKITELSGDKTEALATFIKEGEAKLRELKSAYEAITEFKDRKDRKAKEQLYEQEAKVFHDEKARLETELQQEVGAYQALLQDVEHRREVALKDVQEAYDKSSKLLDDTIQQYQQRANDELASANNIVSETDAIFQQFNLQTASRTQQQTDAHANYLSTQVSQEEASIKAANEAFDRNKDLLNADMKQSVSNLAQERQEILATYKSNVDQEAENLDQFKAKIRSDLDGISTQISAQTETQNTTFSTIKGELQSTLNEALDSIKATLQTQIDDFEQTTQNIESERTAEQQAFDNTNKQLQKGSAERLKEVVRQIKATLQEHIQSI